MRTRNEISFFITVKHASRLFNLITNPQHEAVIETYDLLVKNKFIMLFPDIGIEPDFARFRSKIQLRKYKNKRDLSEIFRHEEKKRFAMFYPSELWQQYGTSVFPEARFYREIKDKAIGFSPHACSRR
ncbi:hypothetical protein R5R35_005036 [Gryllus longicercus]|uniref:Uncharacterized protein n=1 Tax=Gryllus longicercus TaxID=2509291 RepID=A0AAN9Z8Q1_9ORTH